MRRPLTAVASVAAVAAVLAPAPARADPPARPPDAPRYIDHVQWVRQGDRSTLRIFPTPWGWAGAGMFTNGAQSYDAWNELLENAPEADSQTMLNQFLCYWQLASFTNPAKVGTWNLEPWRPVVSNTIMINSGCNPGGPDEAFD
ncbi:aldehyde dehydrogenase [Mycobacterium alsense]|uniref:Aldehyde dehydrogenase n=1 Tax=Mycobacterium alsense TaxID=324058 RepID=A0AA41XRA4_9MYCO|nr:DUF2599 domain-containing protein [Mycobacterium alsense]MCV7380856.1 DUF2599 domain-containing protein [Mycobacterium alsense]OQZ90579.1 aldehyde dehydrogenase [Mycobacterium alsense]